MKLRRTYPQPDSPEPHIGARERALAVFKYLLDLEPEQAKDHPMFACIVHSYQQAARAALDDYDDEEQIPRPAEQPSLVPMLTSETEVETAVRPFAADGL